MNKDTEPSEALIEEFMQAHERELNDDNWPDLWDDWMAEREE